MSATSTNLVIIKGEKEDLLTFKKIAYKSDSEAFCFQQILPYPNNFEGSKDEVYQQQVAYSKLFYGNEWGAGYGILMRSDDNSLMYMFNSKTTIANLKYVSQKFIDLEFIHIGIETNDNSNMDNSLVWRYIKYENAEEKYNYFLGDNFFDFQITSYLYSYEYIAELYIKIESLIKHNIFIQSYMDEPWGCFHNFPDVSIVQFYDLFHKSSYIGDKRILFDKILTDVENIKQQNLKYAMEDIDYPFSTNNLYFQLAFVKHNYNHEVQNYYLEKIENRLDFSKTKTDDLLLASKYLFDYYDNNDLFLKLIKVALTRLTEELDNILESHELNKVILKDYPGIIPHYSVDNKLIDKYFNLYEWDVLEKEINEYNFKLNIIQSFKSDFYINFYTKVERIERGTIDIQDKLKIREYLKEALNYFKLSEYSYQKLIDRLSDINNSFSIRFDFAKDTQIDCSHLKSIAYSYGVFTL